MNRAGVRGKGHPAPDLPRPSPGKNNKPARQVPPNSRRCPQKRPKKKDDERNKGEGRGATTGMHFLPEAFKLQTWGWERFPAVLPSPLPPYDIAVPPSILRYPPLHRLVVFDVAGEIESVGPLNARRADDPSEKWEGGLHSSGQSPSHRVAIPRSHKIELPLAVSFNDDFKLEERRAGKVQDAQLVFLAVGDGGQLPGGFWRLSGESPAPPRQAAGGGQGSRGPCRCTCALGAPKNPGSVPQFTQGPLKAFFPHFSSSTLLFPSSRLFSASLDPDHR